jgi:imidazolonepropionase-like amidohydrolase
VRTALYETFRRAYESGVKLVLGTDAGRPFNRHGQNATELALMVRLGEPANIRAVIQGGRIVHAG